MNGKITFWQIVWVAGMAHIFVWGPCVVLDLLFCHGKMLRDPFSLFIIETASLIFTAAKTRQVLRK